MANGKRILIPVDSSKASRRAVNYVIEMIAGNPGFHVGFLHLELPPRMLEWGGSEDADVEEEVEAERAAYQEMELEAIETGRTLLQGMQSKLASIGIDVTALKVQFDEPLDPSNIASDILKTAAEGRYGTVVVGRHSFSKLKQLLQHHVGEELVRFGDGLAVWVVE